jgi:methylated-DNA-[protein]-cysteine S-methyltransferase
MASIQRTFLKTPIGFLELTGSKKGLHQINFLDFRVKILKPPPVLREAVKQLEEYFSGKREEFTIPLDLEGTPFQLRVWEEIQKIPFGTTATYLEIAEKLGNTHTMRAVGGANGCNPVPIVVPCHRVIGSNGKLIGYAGGLKRKKWLLEHENAFSQKDLFYTPVK